VQGFDPLLVVGNGEISKEYVSLCVKVSIADQITGGASKDLAATQLLVQGSTTPPHVLEV